MSQHTTAFVSHQVCVNQCSPVNTGRGHRQVTLNAGLYMTNPLRCYIVFWKPFTVLSGDCSPCTQPRICYETLSAPLQWPCRPFPLCLCLCLPLLRTFRRYYNPDKLSETDFFHHEHYAE